MTTKNNLSPLVETLQSGVTILFTHDRNEAIGIERELSKQKVACVSTRWSMTETMLGLHRSYCTQPHDHGDALVLIAVLPLMTQGFKVGVDRMVWMDVKPVPRSRHYAAYMQALARCEPLRSRAIDTVHCKLEKGEIW